MIEESIKRRGGLYTPDLISSKVKSTEVFGVWGRGPSVNTPDLIGGRVKQTEACRGRGGEIFYPTSYWKKGLSRVYIRFFLLRKGKI